MTIEKELMQYPFILSRKSIIPINTKFAKIIEYF